MRSLLFILLAGLVYYIGHSLWASSSLSFMAGALTGMMMIIIISFRNHS